MNNTSSCSPLPFGILESMFPAESYNQLLQGNSSNFLVSIYCFFILRVSIILHWLWWSWYILCTIAGNHCYMIHFKFVCFYLHYNTTRKRLTTGTLKRLTAGTFVFAGDHLAGGKPLPPAHWKTPGVTQITAGTLANSPGVLFTAGTFQTAGGIKLPPANSPMRQRYVF